MTYKYNKLKLKGSRKMKKKLEDFEVAKGFENMEINLPERKNKIFSRI